ncbi:hypothetical protein CFP56_033985 [Quercus suber]|uniref:Uncharacterized protein n=1 Tax=Quercus suber TaxID=58331 RepID=A0AAW0JF39_QUESU
METLSLFHSHSHTSSILYTHKPLTTTNQAFPLFLLPCTRYHSTNHLFSSSLHLHRPSPFVLATRPPPRVLPQTPTRPKFFSGCLYSSGLQHGMGEIDQTREDLEDNLRIV